MLVPYYSGHHSRVQRLQCGGRLPGRNPHWPCLPSRIIISKRDMWVWSIFCLQNGKVFLTHFLAIALLLFHCVLFPFPECYLPSFIIYKGKVRLKGKLKWFPGFLLFSGSWRIDMIKSRLEKTWVPSPAHHPRVLENAFSKCPMAVSLRSSGNHQRRREVDRPMVTVFTGKKRCFSVVQDKKMTSCDSCIWILKTRKGFECCHHNEEIKNLRVQTHTVCAWHGTP